VSRTEPSREFPTKVLGAGERQRAVFGGVADREVAKTNLRKSPEVSDYFEVDPESRVEEAYVDFVPVQHEPVTPFRRLPKLEKDHDSAIGQIFGPHEPVHNPHEEVGIEVLVAEITS
jgi:hypothetical protein